ncbi:UNVERIFIED_CONTAM: hypothetical protein FKN15_042528 [Acipenser sinensis]
MGSANDQEPAQLTPAEGPEGGEEPESAQSSALRRDPLPHEHMDQEPCPQPTTEGPKGGEKPGSTQDGGALEGDPLPQENKDWEPSPTPTTEVPQREEEPESAQDGGAGSCPGHRGGTGGPPEDRPPRAFPSGDDEGSGPGAVNKGETEPSPEAVPGSSVTTEPGPVTAAEGGEGPERVDPLPPRAKDGHETVPRPSKEGLRAGTRQSGSAAYAEHPSAPLKSRVQTVPARVPSRPLGVGHAERW